MNRVLVTFAAAGYGALIGSFLNVCIFRFPRRCLRLWKPKLSFCPECMRTIPWHENIPMISFLRLLGRCKGCKAQIPVRYFLVELATTAFFVWAALTHLGGDEPRWGLAFVHVALFSALLVCALVDWDTMTIPDEVDIPGFLLAPLVCVALPEVIPAPLHALANARLDAGLSSIVGAVSGALAIWTIGWIGGKISGRPDGAMGLGDVKLIAMIGGFTGFQGALAALLGGSVVGSFYGVAQRLRQGDREMCFGPFLALGGGTYAFLPGFQQWWLARWPW